MKKQLFSTFIFILFLISANNCFSEYNTYITSSFVNGRAWKTFSTGHKALYIRGLVSGMRLILESSINSEIEAEGSNFTPKELGQLIYSSNLTCYDLYTITDLTYEEIASKIDVFYEDEFNLIIPVWEIYRSVTADHLQSLGNEKKIGGKKQFISSEYNRETALQDLRKKYTK